MFKKIIKKLGEKKDKSESPEDKKLYNLPNEQVSVDNLNNLLKKNDDYITKDFYIDNNNDLKLSLAYIDGMSDKRIISDYIYKPLLQQEQFRNIQSFKELVEQIDCGRIYFPAQKKEHSFDKIVNGVLSGNVVMFISGVNFAYIFETKGFEKRSVTEPSSENVIKGSKDAFVENLQTNTSLIRRKLKSPQLTIEYTTVGKLSATTVAVFYIEGVTNPEMINEVKQRLKGIDVDNISSIGVIEEFIYDHTDSLFPQSVYTERVDKFSASLSEGRIGIITDGFPMAIVIPVCFLEHMSASEDYSKHYVIASLGRILRYGLAVITLVLPGFYIALTTYHPEMIPGELVDSIIKSKEGIPFPVFIETLAMLIAFEVLYEAALRMPKIIGQAVSIVGALIVGEAAVNAKIVSPAVVIVIAITAIASFTVPSQDMSNALRVWRFAIAVLSSITGLFGMVLGIIVLVFHLSSIEILGVPYLSPIVSTENVVTFDSYLRWPTKMNALRPLYLNTLNRKRRD